MNQELKKDSDQNSLTEIDGELYTLKELSRNYKIKFRTLQARYANGERGNYLIRRNPTPITTYVPFEGRVYTLNELAHKNGFLPATVRYRFNHGFRGEALITPDGSMDTIKLNGSKYTINDLSKMYGLSDYIIKRRYKLGKREGQLVAPSRQHHKRVLHTIYNQQYTFKELHQEYRIPLNALYNRYYHYNLRNEALIYPELLNIELDMSNKKHSLTKLTRLAHLYQIPMNRLVDQLKNEYDEGIRGNGLIQGMNERYESTGTQGQLSLDDNLANEDDTKNDVRHLFKDPIELDKKLPLQGFDVTSEEDDHNQDAPTTKDFHTRQIQGTVIDRPQLLELDNGMSIATFSLFTMDKIDDSSQNVVHCVAFNNDAEVVQNDIDDKHVYLDITGKMLHHDTSDNQSSIEMIINNWNVLDDENMFED